MQATQLVYFGKPGSFTHLVAKKIHGKARLVSKETVAEVIDYVNASKSRMGIVPVENSSSGMILETIDNLLKEKLPLSIQAEYSINVKLALLGKTNRPVKKIYSHFAPFYHCESWIKEHYPKAAKGITDSTSAAAQQVSEEPGSAAIAPLSTAKKYKLSVIHERIAGDKPNLTQFFVLGHQKTPSRAAVETSFSVVLKNEVGSLNHFLMPFAAQGINLKRIMSRPIMGQPNHYFFFVGVESSLRHATMKQAMQEASKSCQELRILGSYPVHSPFEC